MCRGRGVLEPGALGFRRGDVVVVAGAAGGGAVGGDAARRGAAAAARVPRRIAGLGYGRDLRVAVGVAGEVAPEALAAGREGRRAGQDGADDVEERARDGLAAADRLHGKDHDRDRDGRRRERGGDGVAVVDGEAVRDGERAGDDLLGEKRRERVQVPTDCSPFFGGVRAARAQIGAQKNQRRRTDAWTVGGGRRKSSASRSAPSLSLISSSSKRPSQRVTTSESVIGRCCMTLKASQMAIAAVS